MKIEITNKVFDRYKRPNGFPDYNAIVERGQEIIEEFSMMTLAERKKFYTDCEKKIDNPKFNRKKIVDLFSNYLQFIKKNPYKIRQSLLNSIFLFDSASTKKHFFLEKIKKST